ncbi:hypothetical protein BDV26DRAFT_304021 [Aspergillus bertholletiae]|uniref:Uncharacterized protein n=1 Tax=Aspergillus bertholletiae TaxID=1226010 RepID=A0A5N7BMW7_9EURO|nr:hypothetical protein BDV26DRAFT_304021 [Aspergillus bertholletiae]
MRLSHNAYTAGWICILDSEHSAARAPLDELHDPLTTPHDDNAYLLGRMGDHNVVIVRPIDQGKANAADTAVNMVRTFPQIRLKLVVGVGGGATNSPDPYDGTRDILLGDVVVSRPQGNHGGNMEEYVQDALSKLQDRGMAYFCFPGRDHDLLFRAEYRHPGEDGDCSRCDQTQIVRRGLKLRTSPVVHYGLTASADTTMQDPVFRDGLRKSENVLCFEKEAAGLMDRFPCIAIRGISDYADTHKNKKWQPDAAVTTAAYAKDLLMIAQPHGIIEDVVEGKRIEQCDEVQGEVGLITKIVGDGYRNMILNWLSTWDFKEEHEDMLATSVATQRWLLQSDLFHRWIKGCRWQLRCYGEAGTGKQTPEKLLGSVLKPLVSYGGSASMPQELIEAFNACGSAAAPTKNFMKNTFRSLIKKYNRVYLIIDGLYHCSSEVLEVVKEYAMELTQDGFPLSLLTTSLGYREVREVIICDSCGEHDVAVYFNCDCNNGDFDLCLRCKEQGVTCGCPTGRGGKEPYDTVQVAAAIGVHPWPKYNPHGVARYLRNKSGLVDRIAWSIATRSQLSFVIAQAFIQVLFEGEKEPENDEQVLRLLNGLPLGPFAAYCDERIAKLKRYRTEKELHVAFMTFALMISACEPLTIRQLQHALALTSAGRVVNSTLDDRTFILKSANGLITVDRSDESHSFVRFFHHAVPTVLAKSDHHSFLQNPDYEMAKIYIKYLQDKQSSEHYENSTAYPFRSYALRSWGDHVRRANDQRIEKEASRFLKTLLIFSGESAKWIHEVLDVFHLCSWFGLTNMVKLLVAENHHIGIRDPKHSRTPLRYACINEHVETVVELLEHDVLAEKEAVVDVICGLDCSMHSHYVAVFLGHKSINIDAQDSNGFTALSFAVFAEEGVPIDLGLVRLLLQHGPNPNTRDNFGNLALILAIRLGALGTVEALLKCDREEITTGRADLAHKCMLTGNTLLHMATVANETDILRLLLVKSKLWPDSAVNEQGRTPLYLAMSVEVAKLLVENGCDVNSTDFNNATPLDIAHRASGTRDVIDYLEASL